jgi:hypothetical protein
MERSARTVQSGCDMDKRPIEQKAYGHVQA